MNNNSLSVLGFSYLDNPVVAARASKVAYRNELMAHGASNKRADLALKYKTCVVPVGGVLVPLVKPSMQTNFYFAEYGHDFVEKQETCHAASQSEQFFMDENQQQAGFDYILDCLASYRAHGMCARSVPVLGVEGDGTGWVAWVHPFEVEDKRVLEIGELAEYEAACKYARDVFQKRLNTYLKRYGLSKCSYSTFWGDR